MPAAGDFGEEAGVALGDAGEVVGPVAGALLALAAPDSTGRRIEAIE